MPKLTLKIEKMMCESCVKNVEKALTVPGVTDLKVLIGKAVMQYDESKVAPETLLKAVIDAGYPAKIKKGLF
ncbi:MAG: heavy metal-associated domain-containing protein [Candidatus Methanomethylophilus sp.]|jgi:copper chaperone CopZ|nr:heavy metal-associated domain-containing protein [Methanomethylophilus sp.]MDD3232936.1 heavy metal-associated domain-containing protein [Methanomethylophilus sp.]MDD4221561.1 heavy metal-associated domain-containing protein [Methanomethylophilus sp.]MDD4668539.1 heavy metal-associated domain-containing protein [Methanomethylophilus sp.]